MKYVSILLFTILAFCSCQKEDALENEIDFSNPYAIEDSDDPIQKRRFEIFNKYGVPVYFNDTIGRQFVRNDINGNPYYRYETIDLNWIFYTPNQQNQEQVSGTFKYFYVEDQERQKEYLNAVEDFLESLVPDMYPTMILLVDSAIVFNDSGKQLRAYGTTIDGGIYNPHYINFRCVLITRLADWGPAALPEEFIDITKDLALSKVYNYTEKLNEFNSISDPTSYGTSLTFPNEEPYWGGDAYRYYYARPECFFYSNYEELARSRGQADGYTFDEAWMESSRTTYASIVGPYGFVSPNILSSAVGAQMRITPSSTTIDVEAFTQLALQYSRAEFERYWRGYPLVMKKYNIIRDILENDMKIELE